MKKLLPFLRFSFLILLLEVLGILGLSLRSELVKTVYPFRNMSIALVGIWFCGMVFLLLKKGQLGKILSRILNICTALLSCVVLFFLCGFLLLLVHPDQKTFSLTTPVFSEKNVMVVVPHQDDDINLLGGLIEQYTDAGSELSVVFTTNGDRYGESEIRAEETAAVLTALGVAKEDIYYLGFGDQWVSQTFGGSEITHIYNSPDPDTLWTSLYGATETYGTSVIDCYLELPYTRNNYLRAIESIILKKRPDTIFAVDFDSHIDHKATALFFDEALCNVLTQTPDYHPTVYKGFCYGTAWTAAPDYWDSLNLLSSKLPDEETWQASSFGHSWEDRVRFPMSRSNLNRVLFKNSVYIYLDKYTSQDAYLQATAILNGDKVFWHRRTDSLLYDARILVGSEETQRLNDFKLKDFALQTDGNGENEGIAQLSGQAVTVTTEEAVTLNSIYLYDDPDLSSNILGGFILFPDGSKVEFGALEQDGSPTKLTFSEKQTNSMEIVITNAEGDAAGLTEIEAFYDIPAEKDTFLMAVDSDDNFAYDYLLHETDTAVFEICSFPEKAPLEGDALTLTFAPRKDASCRWKDGTLVVTCEKGDSCTVTVSDGKTSTTFTVSHPADAAYAYLQTLQHFQKIALNVKTLCYVTADYLITFMQAHF